MEMPLPILLFSLFMFLLLSLSCLLVVVAAASFFTKKQLETHSQNFIFFARSNCQLLYMTRLAHFSMLLSLVIMQLRCHCHFCCFRSSCFCNSRCHVCWLLWLLLLFLTKKQLEVHTQISIFLSKQLSAVASAVVLDKISSFFNVVVIGNNAIKMPLAILLFLLFMFLLLSLSCLLVVVAAASFFH